MEKYGPTLILMVVQIATLNHFEHKTQLFQTIAVPRERGVRVRATMKDRHALTTRRDGWI